MTNWDADFSNIYNNDIKVKVYLEDENFLIWTIRLRESNN